MRSGRRHLRYRQSFCRLTFLANSPEAKEQRNATVLYVFGL